MARLAAKRSVSPSPRASVLGALLVLAACGGGGSAPTNSGISGNGPAWMNKGSGQVAGERGRAFYGLGVSQGVKGQAMRRKDADGKAREELSAVVAAYASRLAKSSAAGDAAQEQSVAAALKSVSQRQLAAARIVDHFLSRDGNESALASLDLETFKASLDKAQGLGADLREAVKAAADKAFDEGDEPKS